MLAKFVCVRVWDGWLHIDTIVCLLLSLPAIKKDIMH